MRSELMTLAIAALVVVTVALVGCSDDDDSVAEGNNGATNNGATSDAGNNGGSNNGGGNNGGGNNGGGDASQMVDTGTSGLSFCGDGETTGEYVQSVMTHSCAGGNTEIHSFITLYQCEGCTSPTSCDVCEDPAESYIELHIGPFDQDRTGETITGDDFFAFASYCRIGGSGCVEPESFEFVIEEHSPGECIQGTYSVTLTGGEVKEGSFDAGSRTSPTQEEIDACASGG